MKWYWNMGTRAAMWFFAAQFVAVALVAYLICGVVWSWWTSPAGVLVPLWAGIVGNVLWTVYNISQT